MTWARISRGIWPRLRWPQQGQLRVSLVLGNDRRQLGEFGNLMPARLRVARSRLGRQRSLALGADRGHIGHDLVDPLGRETMAMMSRMSGLTAWFASARGLAHRLGGTQRIGRRGDRGVGRVLIEPFLEVPDEGFEFGDPRVELSALGTRRYWGRRGVVHAAGQYGLLTVWQEQVSSRGNSRHPPVKNEIPGHPSTKDAEQGTGRLLSCFKVHFRSNLLLISHVSHSGPERPLL